MDNKATTKEKRQDWVVALIVTLSIIGSYFIGETLGYYGPDKIYVGVAIFFVLSVIAGILQGNAARRRRAAWLASLSPSERLVEFERQYGELSANPRFAHLESEQCRKYEKLLSPFAKLREKRSGPISHSEQNELKEQIEKLRAELKSE